MGSIFAPTEFGSGGGHGPDSIGGAGGGAIHLEVGGTLRVDGEIRADGADETGRWAGGGAGGSVWLKVETLAGGGKISANGGSGHDFGGGGGGGRIAIEFTENSGSLSEAAQMPREGTTGTQTPSCVCRPAALSGRAFLRAFGFTASITAYGGSGFKPGGAGTIYTKQTSAPGHLLIDNGGQRGGVTLLGRQSDGSLYDLTLSGAALVSVLEGERVVWNQITCRSYFSFDSPTLTVTNLDMEAGAQFKCDASFLRLTVLGKATIDANSGVTADGLGYSPYGTHPANGRNGGTIEFSVAGTLRLDGTLSANGANALQTNGAGGAGGSITVTARTLTGSGSLLANGGNGDQGNGGNGGRMAVYSLDTNDFTGNLNVAGGAC